MKEVRKELMEKVMNEGSKKRINGERVLYFLKYAFSSITLKYSNFHKRRLKIFDFHIFGLECCLHPYKPC